KRTAFIGPSLSPKLPWPPSASFSSNAATGNARRFSTPGNADLPIGVILAPDFSPRESPKTNSPRLHPLCTIIFPSRRPITMPRFLSVILFLITALPLRAQTPPSFQPPAQDHLVQLLKELTEAPGPPGYEEAVRKIMTDRF